MRAYSLAHLTVIEAPPPRLMQLAAGASYSHVGLRLAATVPGGPAYLLDDPAMARETEAVMAGTGVGVFDIEMIWLRPDTDLTRLTPFLEMGARLGAKAVLVGGDDPVQARLIDRMAAFCEMAAPYGLTINLELMPWTATPDLPAAVTVLNAVDKANAGLLVDALHFHRSRSKAGDLKRLAPSAFNYMQLCDALDPIPDTVAGLQHTARNARLMPGEGDIDLGAIIGALPARLPISLEVPNSDLAQTLSDEDRVARAIHSARRVVEAADASRS